MSDNVIDEIKQKIDIVEFIGQYVNLKPAGSNYKALCPFHQEKTPSFFVSPERQFFKCFGCGEGGDVFNFLMKIEGVTFAEALKILADKTGVKLTRSYQDQKAQSHKDQLFAVNKIAAHFYHHLLTNHPIGQPARQYLKKRQINPDTIKTFYLGYAPPGWDSLVKFLIKKKISLQIAHQAGLIIKGQKGYYDRFRHRIIFPLFNILGEIIGFGGRIITDDPQSPKYINTPETPIYHKSKHLFGLYQTKQSIKSLKSVIITEGEFDVLSSYQIGVKNIVAVKGSALTESHLKILKRYANQVIFCFDQDSAGLKATTKSLILAENQDLKTAIIPIPAGKDIDELVKTDPTTWRQISQQPTQGFKYLLSTWQSQTPSDSAYSTKELLNQVFDFVSQLNDVILKDQYLNLTAQTLNLDISLVKESFVQYQTKKPLITTSSSQTTPTPTKPQISPEAYLLALILRSQNPKFIQFIQPDHFTHPGYVKLARLITQNPQLDQLPQQIPDSLSTLFNELFILPTLDQILDKGETKIKQEIQKLARRLYQTYLENQINHLKTLIRQKEKDNQPTTQETQRLQDLLTQLRKLK